MQGRNSYRELQNDFHAYVTSKGFDLERGLPVEEIGAKHQKIEDLKKITNFENTKKVLDNIKLELPKVPDTNDIKLLQLNKAKVEKDIIKPKDDLINELYNDNKALHQELSKQVKLVNEAEKYQKERDKILADNKTLNNKVKDLELDYNNRKNELEDEYKNKEFDIEYKYKHNIKILEKENSHLHKIVDRFYETVEKFIEWVCKKFGLGESKELVKDFEKETNTLIDSEKQLKKEEREKASAFIF
ncbi:MAG: hypothetical protein HFJ35_02240 [Clostridia bacterium]|nr:hypothetical protein [Clostridia bacterium]